MAAPPPQHRGRALTSAGIYSLRSAHLCASVKNGFFKVFLPATLLYQPDEIGVDDALGLHLRVNSWRHPDQNK